MERYRVFDGTYWRSICGCGYHVRDTSGTWKLVDPASCPDVRYYNAGVWTQINCCYENILTTCGEAPPYCSSEKILVEVVLPAGGMNDRLSDVPTCEELNTLDCTVAYNTAISNYLIARNTFLANQLFNFEATLVGLPAPYVLNYASAATTLLPYKASLKKINITAYCPASTYPEWLIPDGGTGFSPNDVMPGVYDFTFLPSVANVGDLPVSGSAGDAIYVRLPSPTAYAWDPVGLAWSTLFYNIYFDPIQIIRISQFSDDYAKKRDMFQVLASFSYASSYLAFHLLRKKTIEASC